MTVRKIDSAGNYCSNCGYQRGEEINQIEFSYESNKADGQTILLCDECIKGFPKEAVESMQG